LFSFSDEDSQHQIVVAGEEVGKLHVIDAERRAHRLLHHGVAFWVNSRLVGSPGWQVGDDTVLDGRSREARKYIFVVEVDVLVEDVLPDWTGFKPTERVKSIMEEVARVVREVLFSLMTVRVEEKKQDAVRGQAEQLRELSRTAQAEVSLMVETIARKRPTMRTDDFVAVVEAVVELESSRSGKRLLQRLSAMPEEDLDALDQLLDEWTVQDARAVLDEIDRRLSTAEAIVKLCADPAVDELHTLHPLVTQARWLFGPEYDSPIYASNRRLKNAVEKVLGHGVRPENVPRPLVRPDLLVAANATYSAVAAEDFDNGKPLPRLRRVLLIELKKGGSTIGREEMNQANGYVEDILNSGHLDGPPLIDAFVVGHRVAPGTAKRAVIFDNRTLGNIEAVSFAHLVDTANARLFRLREQLEERYGDVAGEDLVAKVLAEPHQMILTR
ncbi:MAG: ATP-binding protein, partial [Chrysiogenetes bacterium]|nr:ATP-binding protein [Chrysiogenetes bacterium]